MKSFCGLLTLTFCLVLLGACTKGTPEISSLSSLQSGLEIEGSELNGGKICYSSGLAKVVKLKCHDLRIVKIQYSIASTEPTTWTTLLNQAGSNASCASGETELDLPPLLTTDQQFLFIKAQTENAEVPQVKYAIADPSVNPLSFQNSSFSMAASSQLQLQVTGGTEPYKFKILSGEGSIEQNGLYTSGKISGTQMVKVEVTDSVCASPVTAEIQVIGEFGVVLSNVPPTLNQITNLNIDVNLVKEQLQPIAGSYKYSITQQVDCSLTDYVNATTKDSSQNITTSLGSDGVYFLCVWGQKSNLEWQEFAEASKARWTRDTTPPTVAISALPFNYVNQSNQTSVSISGTCSENNHKVTLNINSNSEDLLCLNSGWSVVKDLSSYGDGTLTISITQRDEVGNIATSSAISLTKDVVAPAAPSSVSDGVYGSSLTTSPIIQFTAPTEDGVPLMTEWQVIENTTLAVVKAWHVGSSNTAVSGLSLQESKTYKLQLRAVDTAGNYSPISNSDGWLVDSIGPTLGASFADGVNSFSLSESPTMTWTAATDTGSGLAQYEIAIGSTVGSTDVLNFISMAKVLTGKITGLSLTKNETYYSTIRAKDNAGNYSISKNGDGWVVIGDPCEGIAEGGTCWGGGIYVGSLNGKKYMTTPGGCTDSTTPTCLGTMDTVKRPFTETTPVDLISEVETITSGTQKSSIISLSGHYQYFGYASYYLSLYGGPNFGGYQLASGWCYAMNYGSFDDWFLPNKTEAAFLYCKSQVGSHSTSYPNESPNCTEYGGKKDVLFGFASNNYWVATQISATGARSQSFINGAQSNTSKTTSLFVRCMRSY